VTLVICQNREYGALQRFARVMSVEDAPYLDLPLLDPVLIARGYGIEAREISNLSALSDFIAAGRTSTGPRLAVVPQRGSR
jgi:benzoylformate decarboxylase